jgi:TPR repeat protein
MDRVTLLGAASWPSSRPKACQVLVMSGLLEDWDFKKDPKRARRLLQERAEQGYAAAQRNLGACCGNDLGVAKDEAAPVS